MVGASMLSLSPCLRSVPMLAISVKQSDLLLPYVKSPLCERGLVTFLLAQLASLLQSLHTSQ